MVRKRLDVYRELTQPLVSYFDDLGLLAQVDGDRPMNEVCQDLSTIVRRVA